MKGLKVGEKVMAKWPGSSLWFPAVITALGDDGDSYEVKFEDGTEDELAESHVSKEAAFRRSRSRSPARKSPSRRRSRSPARKASPSRKSTASPSRKSTRSPARSPSRKSIVAQTKTVTTPTRSEKVSQKVSQSVTKRTVTRSESRVYSTRSATRSGAQTLEPAIELKSGRVPKTTSYEFGGPLGCLIFTVVLVFVPFYLYFACNDKKCGLAYPNVISLNWRDYYDCTAYEIVLGYVALQFVFHLIPIGRELRGMPLRSGIRLKYRLNGFLNVLVCFTIFAAMIYYKCGVTVLVDKYLPLCACAMMLATLLAVILYIMARYAPNHALSPKANSGNIVYDFFMGHELHPRFMNVDIKFFAIRISIIALGLFNIAFLVKSWPGFPNNPPYPLLCLVIAQIIYVLDFCYFEEAALTAMDIQDNGVGFFAMFYSFTWICFFVGFPTRYLALHPPTNMPHWCLVPVVLLFIVGYVMYRQSNSMKSRFRRNPNARDVADLESIPTASGRRLLTAGWWGVVRKPNYVGDLMLNLAFALFCGFDSILPYCYPILLLLMLIDREIQDSKICRAKYGAAWDRYCKRVPYRFIPKVY